MDLNELEPYMLTRVYLNVLNYIRQEEQADVESESDESKRDDESIISKSLYEV